ncbi:MAG: SPOR domain-containing protein [Betaproteobacteria bacterium]|nr:SPOR domain-containing protein [Betaproteobacteria bacterium]
MPPNSNKPAAPPQAQTKSRTGRRLIAAAVLIGLAIGGLALVDRFRERPAGLTPPHEPSQALITPSAPESNLPAVKPEPPITPPPPPQVVNNEMLAPPPRATSVTPSAPLATQPAPSEKAALAPGKAYMVQVGVFTSPANAQALQKQLQRAGIEAHLETRVQLGPFKDKRDAEKALARAKKLGINAVMVSAR